MLQTFIINVLYILIATICLNYTIFCVFKAWNQFHKDTNH